MRDSISSSSIRLKIALTEKARADGWNSYGDAPVYCASLYGTARRDIDVVPYGMGDGRLNLLPHSDCQESQLELHETLRYGRNGQPYL